MIEFEFSGVVFQWRGPAPFYYVAVPEDESEEIKQLANAISYGWGVIPVTVLVGDTEWQTSLFPKDGLYLVPLKDRVRKAENIDDDDEIRVRLTLSEPR